MDTGEPETRTTKPSRTQRPRYDIVDVTAMRALTAPLRQEIVDTVSALGVCSVRQIAEALGCPADGLYYHVRALLEAGLLVSAGTRPTRRRDEALVSTPTRGTLHLRYQPDDEANAAAVGRIVASMLRVAERDFHRGFRPQLARVAGEDRNLHANRQKAWLRPAQRREVNRLLHRLQQIFASSRPHPEAELQSLTFVHAPIQPGVPEPGSARRRPKRPSRSEL